MSKGRAIARQRKNMLSYCDSTTKVDKKLDNANGIRGTESGIAFEGRIRGGPGPEKALDLKPGFGARNPGFLKGRKMA